MTALFTGWRELTRYAPAAWMQQHPPRVFEENSRLLRVAANTEVQETTVSKVFYRAQENPCCPPALGIRAVCCAHNKEGVDERRQVGNETAADRYQVCTRLRQSDLQSMAIVLRGGFRAVFTWSLIV